MLTTLVILIAIVSLLLIGAILIQNPKGGGIDATMGGSANQMFGATRSADFIEKASWYLGGALLILCIITAMTVGGPTASTDGTEQGPPLQTEGTN